MLPYLVRYTDNLLTWDSSIKEKSVKEYIDNTLSKDLRTKFYQKYYDNKLLSKYPISILEDIFIYPPLGYQYWSFIRHSQAIDTGTNLDIDILEADIEYEINLILAEVIIAHFSDKNLIFF